MQMSDNIQDKILKMVLLGGGGVGRGKVSSGGGFTVPKSAYHES